MSVPAIIPIAHAPEHCTRTIGRFAAGQFLASVTYGFPDGFALSKGWEAQKRLYTVLHTFDDEGAHTGSDIWCAGTWAEQRDPGRAGPSPLSLAQQRLDGLLSALPDLQYGDIAIRPFRVVQDDVVFGLVTECHSDDETGPDDWAELCPDQLGFSAPWDGTYDT
ncbi:hypothetical protein OG216_35825 [Streptomycetaceae bacterium NBC_01309]